MLNKSEYCDRVFLGIRLLSFTIISFEFEKNANSSRYDEMIQLLSLSVLICLATVGVCVFYALVSTGAFFIAKEKKDMARIIIRWKSQFAGSACKFDVYLMNTYIGELRCGNAIAVTADVGTHLLVFRQKLKIGKKTDTYFEVVVNDATEIVELKTKFDMNGKFTVSYADNAPHIPAYAGLAADNVSTAVNEAQYKCTSKSGKQLLVFEGENVMIEDCIVMQ